MSFDYTKHEDDHVGYIEFGCHSMTEIEIYKVNGELVFMDHDDQENPMTYDECKSFFYEHDSGPEWEEQMKEQRLLEEEL